jgi:hypothetical protein
MSFTISMWYMDIVNVRCMLDVKALLVIYVTHYDVSFSSTSILQPRHGCPLTSVVRPQVGKLAVVATTQQSSVAPAGTKLVTLRTTGKILSYIAEYKIVPLYSLQKSTVRVYFCM